MLCHGAFSGAWIWREVASLLRSAGNEVYTPTFTGTGERSHLANPDIDLDTHIQDITMVFEFEDLSEVILVGYSYSGSVITGVAEQIPELIQHLVYLDAFVHQDGQSQADLVGLDVMSGIKDAAHNNGDGWRIPHNYHSPQPPAPRRTDLLLKTVLQPVSVKNPSAAALPHTFIYCLQGSKDLGPVGKPITKAAEFAKIDDSWQYLEIDSGHYPWDTIPQELTDLLLRIA